MRLFDIDKVGVYLDGIGHRVERENDAEIKMVDLTLRVQPLTPELASALDPDVRALLFSMHTSDPKPKIKTLEFNLIVDRQLARVFLLPEETTAQIAFSDLEISSVRARREKGVDGFGLVFYASFGPVGKDELEYICNWHTQQRFVTFDAQDPSLDFAKPTTPDARPPGRQRRRPANGAELRPGVHAEH